MSVPWNCDYHPWNYSEIHQPMSLERQSESMSYRASSHRPNSAPARKSRIRAGERQDSLDSLPVVQQPLSLKSSDTSMEIPHSPGSKFLRIQGAFSFNGYRVDQKVKILGTGFTGTIKWIGRRKAKGSGFFFGVKLNREAASQWPWKDKLTDGFKDHEELVHTDRYDVIFLKLEEFEPVSNTTVNHSSSNHTPNSVNPVPLTRQTDTSREVKQSIVMKSSDFASKDSYINNTIKSNVSDVKNVKQNIPSKVQEFSGSTFQPHAAAIPKTVRQQHPELQHGDNQSGAVSRTGTRDTSKMVCRNHDTGYCKCEENDQYYELGYFEGKNLANKKSIGQPTSDNPYYLRGYDEGRRHQPESKEYRQYLDGFEHGWQRNGGYHLYPRSKELHYIRGFDDGDSQYQLFTHRLLDTETESYWRGYDDAHKGHKMSRNSSEPKDSFYVAGYQHASTDYLMQIAERSFNSKETFYQYGYQDGKNQYKTADGRLVSSNPDYLRGYNEGLKESGIPVIQSINVAGITCEDLVFRGAVEQQVDGTFLTTIVPPFMYRRPAFKMPEEHVELEDLVDNIDGHIKPPSHIAQYLGLWKGVQGDQNSCYMDASVFAMFSYLTVFDGQLLGGDTEMNAAKADERRAASNAVSSDVQNRIREILSKQIVNPLRKYGLVSKLAMHEFRKLLDQIGSVKGLTGEEKDPEEFLNLLLVDVFNTEPPISLSNGQESHLFHLLADKDDSFKFPTVQELLERNCLQEAFKFAKIPPYLIVHLPRFGKDFKMYDMIFPSTELDITDLLTGTKQRCFVCSEAAEYECYECYKEMNTISDASFCKGCADDYHRHERRLNHRHRHIDRTVKKDRSSRDATPERGGQPEEVCIGDARCELRLAAVLCIETSHYVTYVASNTTKKARWFFFDSMADREDTTNSNIPQVREVPDFRKKLVDAYEDMQTASNLVRRLVKDGYICFYVNPDVQLN